MDRSWTLNFSQRQKLKNISTAVWPVSKNGQFPYFWLGNMASTYYDYFLYVSIKKEGFCTHKQQKPPLGFKHQLFVVSTLWLVQKVRIISPHLIYRRKERKILQRLFSTRTLYYTFTSSWLLTVQQFLMFFIVYIALQILKKKV